MIARSLPLPGPAAPAARRPSQHARVRGAGTFAAALALHAGALGHWSSLPTPPVPLPTAPLVVDLIEPAPPVPVAAAAPQPEPEPPVPVEPDPAPPDPAPPEPPPLPTPAPLAITPPPKPKPRPVEPKPQPRPVARPRPAPPVATRIDAAPSPLPPAPAPVAAPAVEPARFNAAYLRNPPPRYPPDARAAGEAGRVLLRVRVSTDGRADAVEIAASSGHSRLDEAALAAVRRWRFVPAQQGGQPVAATVTVPILFKLES